MTSQHGEPLASRRTVQQASRTRSAYAPMTPWRRLGDCQVLTSEDWAKVYMAQQAFVYQVRRIVADAEERAGA
jgi:hypothetical protein